MRDLLLFAIILALIPFILKRPWLGVLTWFWIGLMVPQSHTWGFMQTFPLAMIIGLATMGTMLFNKDRQSMPMTREMVMMFVFLAYMAMTSAFAVNRSGAWDQWNMVMKIFLMTFITPMLIFGPRRIVWLLLVATVSIGFYGFKGGIFTIATGGGHSVLGPDRSFLSGNTYVGLAMIMILPLLLATARMFRHRWFDLGWPMRPTWYLPVSYGFYAAFWLTGLAIIATYSRGAWLGLIAVAPFIFLRLKRKWLIVTLAVLGIGVVGVAAPDRMVDRWSTIGSYEEDTSAMQRIQAWGVNWNMAMERPITGMGFRNASLGYQWWVSYANFEGHWRHALSPHSIYFQVLGQHGFGGLAVFLTLIGFTFLTLGRIRRSARKVDQMWLSEYAWALQIGIVGYLVAGAFLDVAYFNLLYAFVALAIIMRRELDETAKRAREEKIAMLEAGGRPPVDAPVPVAVAAKRPTGVVGRPGQPGHA